MFITRTPLTFFLRYENPFPLVPLPCLVLPTVPNRKSNVRGPSLVTIARSPAYER